MDQGSMFCTFPRTTVCFDQCCSKINRESKVQTEQFNKEDCQESSAEKYRSFEHNGVEIHDQESEKQRKACFRFTKKDAKLTAEDLNTFYFQMSVLNIFPKHLNSKKRYRLGLAGM